MLLTAFFALLIGLSLGVFGGGGSLLTVALFVYEDIGAQAAIGTSLFVVALTAGAALIQHARAGHVRWRVGALFAGSGMLGAYAGGFAAGFIPATLLLSLLAAVMVVSAVMMLRPRGAEIALTPRAVKPAQLPAQGLLIGALTGLVGAGGGFLVVPALVLLSGISLREAIGTSLLVIMLNALAGLAGHSAHIQIDYALAGLVTLFAIAGTFLGSRLSQRIPLERLTKWFGWFILAIAIWLVYQQLSASWKA
ncbi:MAG: sulfite exporter TauE/SafE family protein [Gammaproteobacteria bacterium]